MERCPFAISRDGPAWKQGYPRWGQPSPPGGLKRGIVPHSMEGTFAGAMSVLDGPRSSSWQFSILLDGKLYQHYPVSAHCWHGGDTDDDGNVRANLDLVGIEHEGRAGNPTTDAQVITLARLYIWLQKEKGFPPYAQWKTVFEHKWVSNTITECPSFRIRHDDVKSAIARLNPPISPPVIPIKKEEEMQLLRTISDPTVYRVCGIHRQKVEDMDTVNKMIYIDRIVGGDLAVKTVPPDFIDNFVIVPGSFKW